MNSISTILLTEDERLVSVPNSAFVKEVIVTTTPQACREVIIPVTIGSDIDPAEFESVVLKSISKLRLHLDKIPSHPHHGDKDCPVDRGDTHSHATPPRTDSIVTEINNRITQIIENMQRTKK